MCTMPDSKMHNYLSKCSILHILNSAFCDDFSVYFLVILNKISIEVITNCIFSCICWGFKYVTDSRSCCDDVFLTTSMTIIRRSQQVSVLDWICEYVFLCTKFGYCRSWDHSTAPEKRNCVLISGKLLLH